MINKSDILREFDSIKACYQSGEYRKFANFDILIASMEKMMQYFDANDLWENTAYGVNESVPYICLYILVVSCVTYETIEELTDCEKYYNFVETWFNENFDKYEGKKDPCFYMIGKCAEEVSEALKKE